MIDPELRERLVDVCWAYAMNKRGVPMGTVDCGNVVDSVLAEVATAGYSVVETGSLERLRSVVEAGLKLRERERDYQSISWSADQWDSLIDPLRSPLDAIQPSDLGDPDSQVAEAVR